MRRVTFYKTNRSDNLLHIESEGVLINLRVNLESYLGQEVTNIQVHVDTEEGWRLGEATTWENGGGVGIRLIKEVK
jgi:hypothetical protein